MNADDREFIQAINNRQNLAKEQEQTWRISASEFDRAYTLGKQNWNWVYINYHTFTQIDFRGCSFRNADLDSCTFQNANLRYANIVRASLVNAEFINCDLGEVGWYNANLNAMKITNCDLRGVNLEAARFRGSQGLKAISPVGNYGRLIYAYVHDGEIRIQVGCRNDVPKAIRAAINKDYAHDPMNQADYLDAVQLLERWGKREIKRLKALAE